MYSIVRSGRLYFVIWVIRPDVYIKTFKRKKDAQEWINNHSK